MAKGSGEGWHDEHDTSFKPVSLSWINRIFTGKNSYCFYSKMQNPGRQCVANIDWGNTPNQSWQGPFPLSFGLYSPYVIDIGYLFLDSGVLAVA